MQRTFDVAAVREQFPALKRTHTGREAVYFDGPGGSQVARSAFDAMTRYTSRGGANLHGPFPTSVETEEILRDTRRAAADLLGAAPEEISFGANMTTITFAVSRALARTWDKGSEIVVTELDHRANVDPWLLAAAEKGATVRWVRANPETLTLEQADIEKAINEKTELVAVGLASNAVGTINDVAGIAKRAHEAGAFVAVDAVHAVPHIPLDRDSIGADVLTCSAYKFFGPHVGVSAVKRDLLETLAAYKVEPAPDYIPDKLETGTQNHEGIAGVKGAVDFIASLGRGSSSREKLLSGMRAIEDYEADLVDLVENGENNLNEENGETAVGMQVMPSVIYKQSQVAVKKLRQVLGTKNFNNPKDYEVLARLIGYCTSSDTKDTALDFFAGSGTTGHAVIGLNREDGGDRKYILVEMGEYFETVLKPRIMKVIYSKDWRDGKPVSREGTSHALKYLKLESYEDALNNVAFTHRREGQEALELYGDEYLLRYMLGFETRGSETLLNVEKLSAPFRYKLRLRDGGETREVPVDLPETFAYLLGLRVRTRRVHYDGERRYLVYRGSTPERGEVAAIWRETEGWNEKDFERDRDFVGENGLAEGADEVFVNGDSFIPEARPLEGVFKRLMLPEV